MDYVLRKIKLSDAEDIARAGNNKDVHKYLRNRFPYPYTLQDAVYFINYCLNNNRELVYVIDIENKACGCISLIFGDDIYFKSAEIGYWLDQKYWHKGIMSNAVKEFCSFIFENFDINRISANIISENIGSRKVLEKNGFKFEGIHKKKIYKDNRYMDEVTYALLRK